MKTNKIILFLLITLFLTGCVKDTDNKKTSSSIVATSPAIADIMDKLNVDLAGVSESKVSKIPERYENVKKVGLAMSPDMEIIKSIKPDYVFSPVSLISDLYPKYENGGINYAFVNLNNIPGMFKSIEDMGKILNRQKEADILVKDYRDFIKDYRERTKNRKSKKVLILMGLPGSYVVATENSYVGSLVKLAGAENVYTDKNEQFLNINPEDMLNKDPDIILRTSHAMPEEVNKMFRDEFKNNDIWKHFKAVKNNKVYDLDYKKFGMSAKFNYKEALKDLEEILYEKEN